MALATVADYISEARRLLQDEAVPYRYSDDDIVVALNIAVGEAYRLRADLFFDYFETSLPSFSSASPGVSVNIPDAYRMAFLYYIVGHSQIADQEDTVDARAGSMLKKFEQTLLGLPQ